MGVSTGSLKPWRQGGVAFPQDVVEFNDAVLNGAMEPLETILGIAHLPLQREKPSIGGLA